MIQFRQGDDAIVPIVVTQTPSIDFTEAEDIIVSLYNGSDIQKKYSLNTKTDYGVVEVDGTDKNQLNVFVEREHSIDFSIGTLKAYVLAVFINAEFPDGKETKSWEITCARVTTGKALDEEL
jgi:hypothetical protein